jgi:hypothetical protein
MTLLKQPTSGVVSTEGLEKAADWAAVGFTLLTGLLTFFGITEGVLDRVLRDEPTAALLVFVLVGLGLVSALLGRGLVATQGLRGTWLVLAITALGWVAARVYPNIGEVRGLSDLTRVLLVVSAVAAVGLYRLGIALPAAAIILAVASTSLGLYGVAKISVLSKLATETPRVDAAFTSTPAGDMLSVTVKVAREDDEQVKVVAKGRHDDRDYLGTVVGEALLAPDGSGDVDRTVAFPLVRAEWTTVEVWYCLLRAHGWCPRLERAVLLAGNPRQGRATVGATIVRGEKAATARVVARAVPRGTTIAVRLVRAGRLVSQARLTPNAAGAATLHRKIALPRERDGVRVEYAVCTDVCGAFTTIARSLP